ncbi:MAG: heavy metal translocating P-type ATPase [Spirochaetia bacterium]
MDSTDSCGCGHCSAATAPILPAGRQSSEPKTAEQAASVLKENLPRLARIGLAVTLLVLGMFGPGRIAGFPAPGSPVLVGVFLLAYLLVGWPVVSSAVRNIIRGRVFDEMFLMTLATAGAFAIGEYPEAVAVMLFYSVGEYFQDLAVGRSRRSIASLMDLRPETVRVINPESSAAVSTAPEAVDVGALIEVYPGERVPLDGIITEGESGMNTSALTGESMPQSVGPGDEVSAGYLNESGRVRIRVTRPFGESAISRILELVQNAAARKAPTERMITRFARVYTPIVVGIAAAVAVLPPLLIPGAMFSDWIYRALVVLVISCPCALVVSIPLSYFAGIGGASRNRVLVKGANYLDALNDVHTVVFDKTGTLTRGAFAVSELVPRGDVSADELLRLAAHAESVSTHPIARSVQDAYRATGKEVDGTALGTVAEERGFGVTAQVGGHSVLAGSHRMMHREEIEHGDCDVVGTTVYVAVDGNYAGYIVVADQLKPEAVAAVTQLRAMGVERIAMLTGDNRHIADDVASRLGIREVHSELLPEDKVRLLERLQNELPTGRKLAFVGDGINDAPVLTRADVGIAMGGLGSDAAIEAADVVLMDDGVNRVPAAILAGRYTQHVVKQNIWFTLLAKAVFISLGAAGIAGMWLAVIGDMGVALVAVLNSTKALRPPNGA